MLDVDDRNTTPPLITGPSGGAGAAASSADSFEDATFVHRFTSSEPAFFSIAEAPDGALVAMTYRDADIAQLNFRTAPDFEAPADAGADNVYEVVSGPWTRRATYPRRGSP